MNPSVSVFIPTYNWSTVLPYSIGSVLRQTFTDFELLVVGDGCTDDSAEVVAAIDDPRVRWINLPANSGHQSALNNEGLRQAATRGAPTARRASVRTRARCDTRPRMRVSVPHNTDRDTARRKVEARLQQLLSQYGGYLNGVDQRWEG